jgi:cell division protease FtsH
MSERTLETIDDEVSVIVHAQLERARAILREFRDKVEIMADALLERETLNRSDVELIMAGRPLPPPASFTAAVAGEGTAVDAVAAEDGTPTRATAPETPLPSAPSPPEPPDRSDGPSS